MILTIEGLGTIENETARYSILMYTVEEKMWHAINTESTGGGCLCIVDKKGGTQSSQSNLL